MRTLLLILALTLSGCATLDRVYIRWVEGNKPEWTERQKENER
jgi:uncharacterized protein YceK